MKRCFTRWLSFLQLWFFFSFVLFICLSVLLYILSKVIDESKCGVSFPSLTDCLPPPVRRWQCASLPLLWLINRLISAGLSFILSYSDREKHALPVWSLFLTFFYIESAPLLFFFSWFILFVCFFRHHIKHKLINGASKFYSGGIYKCIFLYELFVLLVCLCWFCCCSSLFSHRRLKCCISKRHSRFVRVSINLSTCWCVSYVPYCSCAFLWVNLI